MRSEYRTSSLESCLPHSALSRFAAAIEVCPEHPSPYNNRSVCATAVTHRFC
jgi:hypothetical protein